MRTKQTKSKSIKQTNKQTNKQANPKQQSKMVQTSKIFSCVFALAITQATTFVVADDHCCTQATNTCPGTLKLAGFFNNNYVCCPGGGVPSSPTGNEAACPAAPPTPTTTTTTTSVPTSTTTSTTSTTPTPKPTNSDDSCCTTSDMFCPADYDRDGSIGGATLCCKPNSIISTNNVKTCPGSTPKGKTDLSPLGCCLTPKNAPNCISGTTLATGSASNGNAVCCVDTSFVSTNMLTPQCTDSYVSGDNGAAGVTISVSMVGAAIVAAQMF